MGINDESNVEANLQIGPTSLGMVRLYIEASGGIELPLDFEPEEAEEIAEELLAAARRAREAGGGVAGQGKGKPQGSSPAAGKGKRRRPGSGSSS